MHIALSSDARNKNDDVASRQRYAFAWRCVMNGASRLCIATRREQIRSIAHNIVYGSCPAVRYTSSYSYVSSRVHGALVHTRVIPYVRALTGPRDAAIIKSRRAALAKLPPRRSRPAVSPRRDFCYAGRCTPGVNLDAPEPRLLHARDVCMRSRKNYGYLRATSCSLCAWL